MMNSETVRTATPESFFLDTLRTKTAAAHKSLEQLEVSASILNPAVTKEEYARYLVLMYDVVKDLETNIYPIVEKVIPDISDREKSQHITRDLAVLGFEAPKRHTEVFDTSGLTLPFALGVAYVVEGSTLGGRFILKNIQAALGYDDLSGASYFAGYGNRTGSRWKTFLDFLTRYAVESQTCDEIISGAEFAFYAIGKHLGQP